MKINFKSPLNLVLLGLFVFGFSACQAPAPTSGLTAQELEKKISTDKNLLLIDLRHGSEYHLQSISGAINIPYDKSTFEKDIAGLDKSKTIVVFSASGGSSEEALETLKKAGFTNVSELESGVNGWLEAGKALSDNFEKAIAGDKLVMVDFYTTWCGPCKMMAPFIHKIEKEREADVTVVKIDAEKYSDIAAKYQIMAYPTLILFKKDSVVYRNEGGQDFSMLSSLVNQYK